MELWEICVLICVIKLVSTASAEEDELGAKVPVVNATCLLPNGALGICFNARFCQGAKTENAPVNTCHSEEDEKFVCCRIDVAFDWGRPVDEACSFNYPVEVPIFGLDPYNQEFPYTVALGWESTQADKYDYKCSGVLFDEKYILTAAHCACIDGYLPVVALPGGIDLNDTSVRPVNISKITVHPDYKPNQRYHDIAIVELVESYTNSGITSRKNWKEKRRGPACIWSESQLPDLMVSNVGYDHRRCDTAQSQQLLKSNLSIVSNEACAEFYPADCTIPEGIAKTQLCAEDTSESTETCQVNSGGPLIVFIKTNPAPDFLWVPYILGIASFGQICTGSRPAVYTRVSEYVDWIEKTAWTKGRYISPFGESDDDVLEFENVPEFED